MKLLVFIILLCFLPVVYAGDVINVYEIDPFYSFSKRYNKNEYKDLNNKINPLPINILSYNPSSAISLASRIDIKSLKGEKIYKGIVIENKAELLDLEISLDYVDNKDFYNESNLNVSIVSSWFQSGKYTTFSKKYKYLVHELLLKKDYGFEFNDSWEKENNKWYYIPPELSISSTIETKISRNNTRRLLLEINTPDHIRPGMYEIKLIISNRVDKRVLSELPIKINVLDYSIDYELKNKFDLFIYTYLSLERDIGRPGSYINAQNNIGDYQYQKDMYRSSVSDIVKNGFNGVIVLDWKQGYLDDALKILKDENIKNVVIYSNSPVKNKSLIVSDATNAILLKYGYQPIYYGLDEPGGNKNLKQQLVLNNKINNIGAKSFNACFWDDMPNVISRSTQNKMYNFSYLSYSMGSHGNNDFLNSLPINKDIDQLKQLAYWHPHVEIPSRNKLFMGYWLWASGLDGVSPHGYYFLPHISNFLESSPVKGEDLPSPYDDFSMWDKYSSIFRQHATVYPEKNGTISTLQWEAIADGVTDLSLVLMLENILLDKSRQPSEMEATKILLSDIKSNALINDASILSNRDIEKYSALMSLWKTKIKNILTN